MKRTTCFIKITTLSPVSECRRGLSRGFFKERTEVCDILHSDAQSNVTDGVISLYKQLFCHGDADLQDELGSGITCDRLDFPVQLGLAYAKLGGQILIVKPAA